MRLKLAREGFYLLLGTYLHGSQLSLPPKQPPPSIVPLLKAIQSAGALIEDSPDQVAASLVDKSSTLAKSWAAWISQNKLMTHLDALKDSAHPAIQAAATSAKVVHYHLTMYIVVTNNSVSRIFSTVLCLSTACLATRELCNSYCLLLNHSTL